MERFKEFSLARTGCSILDLGRGTQIGLLRQSFDLTIPKHFDARGVTCRVEQAVKRSIFDRSQDCCFRNVLIVSQSGERLREGFDENRFTLVRGEAARVITLRSIEPCSPISIWNEFVQLTCDSRICDTCCSIDKIEHEIEHNFGTRSREHLVEGTESNAPAPWIHEEECECISRYIFQNSRQHSQEVSRINVDRNIWKSRRNLREFLVRRGIALDEEG